MNWLTGPIWLVALVMGVGLLIFARVYSARKRARELNGAMAHIGLVPLKKPPFARADRKRLALLHRGHSGKFANLFGDCIEVPTTLLFDYSYTFGMPFIAGVRYTSTVAAFRVGSHIPEFDLAPATNVDRLAKKFASAIDLDWDPDFSRRRWLRGRDEHAVRALFSAGLAAHLRELDRAAIWSIEKGGGWLLVYSHGRVFAASALPEIWPTMTALAQAAGVTAKAAVT